MLFNNNDMPAQTRTVGPEGPRDAKIGIIGEAPGAQEIREGRPFIGPAGSLLNKLLSNAGIIRSTCYITNVLKEQPPKTSKKVNDITPYIDLSKAQPKESEIYRMYKEQLRMELEQTSCNLFIAFGNVPLYTLCDIHPPKVTKRRGSVYPCILVPGRKVIATIHPAACLYGSKGGGMYLWQHFILHDLRKAVKEAKSRKVEGTGYEYLTGMSYSECIHWLVWLQDEDGPQTIAFDIEVVNLEVSCISFAWMHEGKKIAISIPFVRNSQDYMTIEQEADIWSWIGMILEDAGKRKVGQNLVFDTQFLFRKYGIVTTNMDDTMIGQGILVPDFPKGLDFIASIYTNEPYYKDDGKKYFKVGGSDEAFWLYNAKDSAVCIEAMPEIMNDLYTIQNVDAYDKQKLLLPILVYMSERGVYMDVAGLKEESSKTGERIEELTGKLQRIAGYDINPNSTKQLKEYFYEKKGYKPYLKRGTGAATTNEDALKRLARKGAPEASILLEIRRLTKLKSSYLDVQLDDDGRLRCSYNPVGAADSGRLSSSKTIWGTGLNMQTATPTFKKYMLFDEGYAGYNMDLGQAENRIVANIAPDTRMMEAFNSGVDVHSLTGSFIAGIPAEDVRRQHEVGENCPLGQGMFPWRFWGKKANHGLNYGMGYKTFAFIYEIPEKEARIIVDRYHAAYPGVHNFHKWIQEQLSRDRTITNLYDRKRLFMDRWGSGLFQEAYSYIPQSTVADKINRDGLIEVYYDQIKYKHVELLNQVHDSIVFQIPISTGWEYHARCLLQIKASLETPLVWRGRKFVIPADLQMGSNMKDVKDVEWISDTVQMGRRLEDVWTQVKSI